MLGILFCAHGSENVGGEDEMKDLVHFPASATHARCGRSHLDRGEMRAGDLVHELFVEITRQFAHVLALFDDESIEIFLHLAVVAMDEGDIDQRAVIIKRDRGFEDRFFLAALEIAAFAGDPTASLLMHEAINARLPLGFAAGNR